MSKKALGKGIDALLGDESRTDPSTLAEVRLALLKPNPQQPRQEFDDASLRELADSIREKGVLQPILAEADQAGAYFIIAGERRVRAARLAGLAKDSRGRAAVQRTGKARDRAHRKRPDGKT